MLPSTTFAALELARQRQDEIARSVRRGHVELASPAACAAVVAASDEQR